MPIRASRPWTERPPISACLDRHRGRVGCARPSHPASGSLPASDPCRKAVGHPGRPRPKPKGVCCGQRHRGTASPRRDRCGRDAGGRPASYHNEAAGLGRTSREEKMMTKADLVEQAADALGPRVTTKDGGAGCRRLPAVKDALAPWRPHRDPGLRHLQGAAPQGPHGPQSQDRRGGRGSAPRCAGLQAFEAPSQSGGPRRRRVRGGCALGGRSRAIVRPSGPSTPTCTPSPGVSAPTGGARRPPRPWPARSDSVKRAERALACHSARSAFTQTVRPALTARRCRCGGQRGHGPPPGPSGGHAECGHGGYAGLAT